MAIPPPSPTARLKALSRESRRLVRETNLTILFAATSLLRSHAAMRAARALLRRPTGGRA